MEYFLQQLINGITLGSIYGLIAIGYTMVYGIIGMINFAHGDVFMVGAFISLIFILMLSAVGASSMALLVLILMLVLLLAMVADFGLGLDGRAPRLSAAARIVPAGAADLGDRHVARCSRTSSRSCRGRASSRCRRWFRRLHDHGKPGRVHGAAFQHADPDRRDDGCADGDLHLHHHADVARPRPARLRAGPYDGGADGRQRRPTISLTFVIGAALAAVAGMMFLLYYGVIDFYIGFLAGIKAFTAAVLGGIGSLPGAMLGGLIIGLIEVFWSAYFSVEYKDVAAFSMLAIVLIFMPSGLLGRPEIEKV